MGNLKQLSTLWENHRVILIGLGALVVVACLGGLIWQHSREQKFEYFDQQVVEFRKEKLKGLREDKVDLETFLGRAREIVQDFEGFSFLGIFLLEVVDELSKREHPEKVVEFLQGVGWKGSLSSRVQELLGFHLAAAREDLGQYHEAILELTELISMGVLKDKIYFDLGRYYYLIGDRVKGEQSFDYVIREYGDSSYAKLAEIYRIKFSHEKMGKDRSESGGGQ